MKCDCCGNDISNGEKYFDATQMNLFSKVFIKRITDCKYEKLFAICMPCVEECCLEYDEEGEKADYKEEF